MLVTDLAPAAVVAAAIAPVLLVLWLAVAADSRPEPPRVMLVAVVLGALSTVVALLLELSLPRYVPVSHNPWLGIDESTLLFIAIPEETVKIAIIAAIGLRARWFDEPMDGVVYGAAVGLGFAAVENLLYLVALHSDWAFVAVIRGVLSVPFHGALGAIAGAYIASARFGGALGAHSHGRWRRARLLASAWLIPVVLHTLYDAAILSLPHATPPGVLELLAMAVAVGFGAIVFAVRLARRIARRQKAWLQTKRLPPADWRGVWARCLIGIGSSVVAAVLIVSGNVGGKVAGWALMALAVGICWHCGKYLSEAAKLRHLPAAVPSPAGSVTPPA